MLVDMLLRQRALFEFFAHAKTVPVSQNEKPTEKQNEKPQETPTEKQKERPKRETKERRQNKSQKRSQKRTNRKSRKKKKMPYKVKGYILITLSSGF